MKIGVVINHMENPETGVAPAYSELREMAQTAEAVRLFQSEAG